MNEEFISEIFNSEENGIVDIILRSWDRIFYTTFVKIIVNYLIDCFLIDEKKVKVILKCKNYEIDEIKEKFNDIIKTTKRRFIYFFIFSFILTLFSLYYITCFNYKYYYITNEWIISSVFLIIFMEILTILCITIETCFRFLGLKLNSEKIYKFSLIFS